MIRTLRLRFVRIVMEAIFVVLVLLLVGLNCVNRSNVYRSIDRRLTYLAESGMGPPRGMVDNTPWLVRSWVDLNSAGIMNETSYFIFSGYMTEGMVDYQLRALSAAADLDAAALLEELLAGSRDRGDVGDYRYYVVSRDTPYKVVFLWCENEFDGMRSLLMTSLLTGAAVFLLVLLLTALLSKKAVRPFAENVENQNRFITNAGHELKTPLGVIISDLDMQMLESGKTEWLQNAQLQADHLALLIDRLTAYSLLSEHKTRRDDPVDLSALGETVYSDFRPLALAREQTLDADIAPGVFLRGDGDSLRTLLSILLDNAVKYTPPGGSIRLIVRQDRRAVVEVLSWLKGSKVAGTMSMSTMAL